MNYIRNMGVDVSAWRSGLKTLLFPDHLQVWLSFRKQDPELNAQNFFRAWDETVPLQGDIAMPRILSTVGSLQNLTVGKIRGLDLPVEIR